MVNRNLNGRPIYNLQRFLRTIATVRQNIPTVIPDGIFGDDTRASVTEFQKIYGLEQTGTVNNETWDSIVEEYRKARVDVDLPQSIHLFLTEDFAAEKGQTHPRLLTLQAILYTMALRFGNIPIVSLNGIYDEATISAVTALRVLFGMNEDGGVDNEFWRHLTIAYESSVLTYDFEQESRLNTEAESKKEPVSRKRPVFLTPRLDVTDDESRFYPGVTRNRETEEKMNAMPLTQETTEKQAQQNDSQEESGQTQEIKEQSAAERQNSTPQSQTAKTPIRWNFI